MSKTLSNILTVFKVARIVAKVIFILCIVGAAGSFIGLVTLPLTKLIPLESFTDELPDLAPTYIACIVGVLACAGEAVMAFLAERYFKNVLSAGTPFTFDGAKEVFRLGIASMIISVAVSVGTGILTGLVALFSSPELAELDFDLSISLSTGLFFLFLSMLFKYGAELNEKKAEEEKQEESAE